MSSAMLFSKIARSIDDPVPMTLHVRPVLCLWAVCTFGCQEQELRELLEASHQAGQLEREHPPKTRAHRRGAGSDLMTSLSFAAAADIRANFIGSTSGAGVGIRSVKQKASGIDVGKAAEPRVPRREVPPEAGACPSKRGGWLSWSGSVKAGDGVGGGSPMVSIPAVAAKANDAATAPAAMPPARPVGADPETHPILELYRSSREPLDQLSFAELKRRIKGAVKEVGGGERERISCWGQGLIAALAGVTGE